MQLVYPYDKTVFPLSVLAPELQWNGAGSGDVYKLHLKEKYFEYTEYFATGVRNSFLARKMRGAKRRLFSRT